MFLAYGGKHVAQPLAAEVGIRIEYAGIAPLIPFLGMTVCHAAEYVEHHHRPYRIAVSIGELSYRIPKPDVLYEGIYEPGVAEIEYEPLLPVPSLYGRDIGIAYLCAFPCLKVTGEEAIFPVVVDTPGLITDTTQRFLGGDDLSVYASPGTDLCILDSTLDVIGDVHGDLRY